MFLPGSKESYRSLVGGLRSFFERLRNPDPDKGFYRYNADHTRLIWFYIDKDCEVDRAAFYSIDGELLRRIMEVVRSGEQDAHKFIILIESVGDDHSSNLIHFAHYNEDGRLIISGGSISLLDEGGDSDEYRASFLDKGHFRTRDLPPRINFGETVKRFLLNAAKPEPSFETPELVPYDITDLDGEINSLIE